MMKFKKRTQLNGICPYFTMFPLEFPYQVLKKRASENQWVLDPFCGRGTTNYASRLLKLPTIGIDSSPVAVALSQAKLANTTPDLIIEAANEILADIPITQELPQGDFWDWAYHKDVLGVLCRLREGLLQDSRSDARKALRAVILGGLHGPRGKTKQSYFSNQSQRTYAPKPGYAVKFWRERKLEPEFVEVLEIIRSRAERYYAYENLDASGMILEGDSRSRDLFETIDKEVDWVITSPPYYGMRTYRPDQWLRLWFLGGSSTVDYSNDKQLEHSGPDRFVRQLRDVWENVGQIAKPNAKMVIRFGGINDRKIDPLPLIKDSLNDTNWRINTIKSAGTASNGKRQSLHMTKNSNPKEEYDLWASWQG